MGQLEKNGIPKNEKNKKINDDKLSGKKQNNNPHAFLKYKLEREK